ncbi:hypothetical protein Tco_0995566 [Tanacetum coccineum]
MKTQKPLLKDKDGEEVDVHMCRSMIGSLMYLTSSRPDIMFVVCVCARYQVNPKVSHLHAVKRISNARNRQWLQIPQQKLSMWLLQVVMDKCFGFRINYLIMGINLLLLLKVNAARHNLLLLVTVNAVEECKGFEQIVDFLNANPIRYALTINPTIYIHCIKQFWSTVKAKIVNGEVQLHALVDGKKIIITESTVRRDLQLEDDEGVDWLPNSTIFEQLTLMGSKTTAWNEFSSTMASTIICLATNQKFNFSKYIFESMLKNLENVSSKFFMYPRMVTKLEKNKRSRTHGLKRLYKVGLSARVESSGDEESLGEDASKQGRRITNINDDEYITLVNDKIDADAEMLDVDTLTGDEVLTEQVVAAKDVNLSVGEVTLAQALAALKSAKVQEKRDVIKEPSVPVSTVTTSTKDSATTIPTPRK